MASGAAGLATERAPFPTNPEEFEDDERVAFSKSADTYILEDAADGSEWEWVSSANKWVPVMDEAQLELQQSAYKVAGVDESAPAVERKKRKADHEEGEGSAKTTKKQRPEPAPKERRNTAVYIVNLPEDVDEEELYAEFSKCGLIARSPDTDQPRIKLYRDEQGHFKGEALIVYFRPESVDLAIQRFDDADFRLGQPAAMGRMRVTAADASYKSQKEAPLATEQAKKKGTGAHRDRQRIIRKNEEMNSRLADWDDDDPQVLPTTSQRSDKVVVLKHMFTLEELTDDPDARGDITDDIRDECAKLGDVTNVTIFDKEPEGVATVRFSTALAAQECVQVMNGRWFNKVQIVAHISNGRERFKKTSRKDRDGDEDDEEARLAQFTKDIEQEDEDKDGEGEGAGEAGVAA